MIKYFLIFLGGGIGSILRYSAGLFAVKSFGEIFPFGTLMINVLGSFFIGFVAFWAFSKTNIVSPNLKIFLTVGVAGGFTTFSTFSYEVMNLLNHGLTLQALFYIIFSPIMGLLAVYLGTYFAKCFI